MDKILQWGPLVLCLILFFMWWLLLQAVKLGLGRLRRRIEMLEASILGEKGAENQFDYLMHRLPYRAWDSRDGKLPAYFGDGFCGEKGLEARVAALEKIVMGNAKDDEI